MHKVSFRYIYHQMIKIQRQTDERNQLLYQHTTHDRLLLILHQDQVRRVEPLNTARTHLHSALEWSKVYFA
jgi:hypothetical protein